MKRLNLILLAAAGSLSVTAQNDVDAIRYARTGVGGSSRFMAMGGAFGALGADVSVASTNPAGLGFFRSGEITYTGGLKFYGANATVYGNKSTVNGAAFVFDNFGIATALTTEKDPDSRHIL